MLQVKMDGNEATKDYLAYKKWEWKLLIGVVVVGSIGLWIGLKLGFSPLINMVGRQ